MYADVVWDRVAVEDDELSFRVGDVIEILDMTDDIWWHGSVHEDSGWFPSTFVRLRIGQESDSEDTTPEVTKPEQPDPVPHLRLNHAPTRSGSSIRRRMTIRRKDSAPDVPKKLSPSEVRAKIVEEILNTERVYVQNLEDIVEGYLKRCVEYSKLFDTERVETIFSNIEQIYNFQRDFLKELEARVNLDRMEDSQIGEVFVLNRHEFAIYSEYCNNHPHTVNEMNTLQQNEQYTFFFESCRLLRNLQDISLEGFLLTPVQKICKYPLQLFGAQASCYYRYRHCHYPHKFNWRTCRCESKCYQVYCPRGKVPNPFTCQCVCQGRNVRCNQFQEFNNFTCRCECVEVIPAKRRGRDRTDDSSKRRGSDSKRSASDSSDSGCPDGSDSKRSASDSSNGGRCPPKEVTTARFCPSGQRLNRRTCRCFIRGRGFRGRDKTDDSSKGGGSDSS